jgi:hypothetical protein
MTTLPPEEKLDINIALRELPPLTRAAALIVSLIEDDPTAAAPLTLISVAARMARHLPPSVRLRVLWHLLETAQEIDAQLN